MKNDFKNRLISPVIKSRNDEKFLDDLKNFHITSVNAVRVMKK